ncbi:MAG: competence protein CoiA family protein, partial [Gallionellaceae bacterium]
MSALLLPFARRLSDGKLVSPDEVKRGRACNCVCPGCEDAVLAKQGTERVWHFAHAEGEKCAQGYEASIHELAKQMLRQRMDILLPALIATASEFDAYDRLLEEREFVRRCRPVTLEKCQTGVNLNGIHVDAVGLRDGHQILIEITVFHRLMPDKRARLIETKIPSMQINLEQFKSMQASRALLERAIFEDESIRQWIYHPKYEPALEKAQAMLDKRLQESKARWESDEALRQEQAARIELKPAHTGWDAKISVAFENNPVQRSNLMLSSAFPPQERITLSAKK